MEKITATINNVIFESKENGYYILSLLADGEIAGLAPNKTASLFPSMGTTEVVAAGNAIFQTDPTGFKFDFTGEWSIHPKYGKQFAFTTCEPEGGDLFFFLAKVVKGLGDTIARRVIKKFGIDTEWIIENEPHRLLEVSGIKEKKLAKVLESFHKFLPIRQLFAYLGPHGITKAMIVKIFSTLGDDSVNLVMNNPYKLTEIHGIGFKKADEVAMATGEEVDSPRRICECVKYVLNKIADDAGDTVVPKSTVISTVMFETSDKDGKPTISNAQTEAVIDSMLADEMLLAFKGGLSLQKLAFFEKKIYEIIKERVARPKQPIMGATEYKMIMTKIEKDMGFPLVAEQRAAVDLVTGGDSTVAVCGYAGSGKTSTSKVMLEILSRVFGRDKIMCVALSGMAASRVRKLSGFESGTIHATLKFAGEDSEYGPHNPLPYSVVLIDEGSMVNSWLFYKILAALGKNTILIMLGDIAQLAPIGAGDPFSDIVTLQLCPVAFLKEIHRQEVGSVLEKNANIIRQGRVPEGYREKGYKDFFFIDKSIPNWFQLKRSGSQSDLDAARQKNNDEIVEYIRRCCERLKPQMENLITDFQVLSPIRKGPLGVDSLNNEIQKVMNPASPEKREMTRFEVIFREGDKVVHTQNKNMPVCTDVAFYLQDPDNVNFGEDSRIFNGSVGYIHRVNKEEETVDVVYPTIETVVRYEFSQMKDIVELAYAMTVHKSQGSEYATVIIPVSTAAFMMMSNRLLYTGITRAKSRILLVGQSYMFERACKNLDTTKRKTVIQELFAQEQIAKAA